MVSRVRVRGIYSTALTKLAFDSGYTIVAPSVQMQERFGLLENDTPPEIMIQDKDDLQGIELFGEAEKVCQFWTFLQEHFLDAILVEFQSLEEPDNLARAKVEFPGLSKRVLDEMRSAVTPTLQGHHRFQIVSGKALKQAESLLLESPEKKNLLEAKLFQKVILAPLQKTGLVRLEHIKPSGKRIPPRGGILTELDHDRIVFRRSFSEGRYDGLDLPIEKGDFGLTEIHEGSWFVRHCYYSRKGHLKGEYFNINTPLELYPYGARYVDLEVDVVRRAGEEPFMIDREKLVILTREGHIGKDLEDKAMEICDLLMRYLRQAEGGWPQINELCTSKHGARSEGLPC